MCEIPIFDKKCYVCRTVLKKVSFFIACFQKNVITKGRRVNFEAFQIAGKEGWSYGTVTGAYRHGLRGESGAGGSGYVDGVAPFTHNGKYYPAETEAGVNKGNGYSFIRYVECA